MVMSMTTSATSVEITGSIALPELGASQTFFTLSANAVATAAAIHTVTAGKTFYLTGVFLTDTSAGGCQTGLTWGGTTYFRCYGGAQTTRAFGIGGAPLATIAAGTAITTFTDSGGASMNYTICGYEV